MSDVPVTHPAPAHLIARTWDRTTLCGAKADEVLPLMLARFVTAHRANYPLAVCPACETAAGDAGIPLDRRPAHSPLADQGDG